MLEQTYSNPPPIPRPRSLRGIRMNIFFFFCYFCIFGSIFPLQIKKVSNKSGDCRVTHRPQPIIGGHYIHAWCLSFCFPVFDVSVVAPIYFCDGSKYVRTPCAKMMTTNPAVAWWINKLFFDFYLSDAMAIPSASWKKNNGMDMTRRYLAFALVNMPPFVFYSGNYRVCNRIISFKIVNSFMLSTRL